MRWYGTHARGLERLVVWLATFSFMALALSSAAQAQRELIVETVAADAGQTVNVSVTYNGDGTVTGLQFDLAFDSSFLALGVPAGGAALVDHALDTEVLVPGTVRILVHSPTNDALVDGTVVTLPFTLEAATPAGFYPIDRSGVVMGDPNAVGAVPTNLMNGGIQASTGSCIAPDNLMLDSQTVNGVQVFEACQTISTGPGFVIADGANVTFRAGLAVILDNGTTVGDADVVIEIDPSLNAPGSGPNP